VKDRREAISASFVILSAGLPESKDLAPLASRRDFLSAARARHPECGTSTETLAASR
jgi:hypothetical protein